MLEEQTRNLTGMYQANIKFAQDVGFSEAMAHYATDYLQEQAYQFNERALHIKVTRSELAAIIPKDDKFLAEMEADIDDFSVRAPQIGGKTREQMTKIATFSESAPEAGQSRSFIRRLFSGQGKGP
jgi:hypothetical protein